MATSQTSTATRKTPVRKATAKKATPVKKAAQPAAKPAAPRKTSAPTKAKTTSSKSTAQVAAKAAKVKKPKLVRDSFTIPKSEYAVIEVLKLRSQKLTHPAKKSELLRAGIKALAAMSDLQFKAALAEVPAIKTGRPKSAK
jgi:hypothetical protein